MSYYTYLTQTGGNVPDNRADNQSENVFIEGTQFYRRSGAERILRIVLIGVVGMVVVAVIILWGAIDAGGRQAYKEARDIRKALRAVGTEYYGGRNSIYDPSSSTGLVPGAAQRIAEISTRDGEVILYSWDAQNNIPLQFEYRKGLYRVVYTDYGTTEEFTEGTEGDFSVYYSFEILKFKAE